MPTKNELQLISKLKQKKYRQINKLFVAEGYKTVRELIDEGLVYKHILITNSNLKKDFCDAELIDFYELKKLSNLDTPAEVLGVFEMKKETQLPQNGKILVLDSVNDPGNLGTIIRLCDWFGIEHIVCSIQTVDMYNPKVIQATMGSIARVHINYTNLQAYFETIQLPIYGTLLSGEHVYKTSIPKDAILIMGSESHGISQNIQNMLTNHITIPQFSKHQKTESLNVASATAIILSEWVTSSERSN